MESFDLAQALREERNDVKGLEVGSSGDYSAQHIEFCRIESVESVWDEESICWKYYLLLPSFLYGLCRKTFVSLENTSDILQHGRADSGQAGVELIMYVGFFLLVVAAATMYFYSDYETKNRVSTAEVTVGDIRQTVDNVYAAGPGRKETITIRVPSGVKMTQASQNRIIMRLGLSGDSVSDALEVTKAPIKGFIPTQEGTHQLAVEYTRSGYITLGNSLIVEQSNIEIHTTQKNATNFTVSVTNAGDLDISAIRIAVNGTTQSWFTVNESLFDLGKGRSKSLLVKVATPAAILPVTFVDLLSADSPQQYAEAVVNVIVGGITCGDTIRDLGEECDTRTPFTFPDNDNPYCPNPVGGVQCDASNHRYKAFDQYGSCLAGCHCQSDTPAWVGCGAGCTDPNYCNNCAHCFDSLQNCGETQVDGGGACPICDGKDDIAEGFQCSLGDTQPCGISDCMGTRTCVVSGSSCQWSVCTTFGMKCPTNKCCTCGGTGTNPQPTYNRTFNTDCTPFADQIACGNPGSCQGGRYRGECSGLNTCASDLDQSTWPIIVNSSACVGQVCGSPGFNCFDQVYPCHGQKTTYTCSAAAACAGSTAADDGVCVNLSSCIAPQTIILHKLDKGCNDYVDAPSSENFLPGTYPGFISSSPPVCKTLSNYNCSLAGPGGPGNPTTLLTYSDIYFTDQGAYYPYRSGKLYIYGKGIRWDYSGHQNDCDWISNICGDNSIRIGNDASNYWEYNGPSWNRNWQRYTVYLNNSRKVVGAPTWNGSIRYLGITYLGFSGCSSLTYGTCAVTQDIVSVEK